MKKHLIYFLLTVSQLCVGQDFQKGDLIEFFRPVEHADTDSSSTKNFNTTNKTINYLEVGYDFFIVDVNDAMYTLSPLDFIPDSSLKIDRSDYYNNRLFKVKKDQLKFAKKSKQTERWSIGLLTLPFKFRGSRYGKTNVYTTEFNVNSTLSYKTSIMLKEASIICQLGFGIGTINLNASNADPSISPLNANILSGFWGVMLQFNRTQAGIYFGQDYIDNQEHYRWTNHGKTWVGVGIGFDVFKPKVPTSQQTAQTH